MGADRDARHVRTRRVGGAGGRQARGAMFLSFCVHQERQRGTEAPRLPLSMQRWPSAPRWMAASASCADSRQRAAHGRQR